MSKNCDKTTNPSILIDVNDTATNSICFESCENN